MLIKGLTPTIYFSSIITGHVLNVVGQNRGKLRGIELIIVKALEIGRCEPFCVQNMFFETYVTRIQPRWVVRSPAKVTIKD
jgi:hypothetical protein